jgi:hypothetical protein
MKEKDGYVDCPQQQVILYVEKDDGEYGPMQTGSFLTKNYLDDYELKRKHLEESLIQKVTNREISPVHFYMVLEDLTLSELASRVGFRKGKVRKHLEPKHFELLTPDIIQKYADVFDISSQELVNLVSKKP